ncbi:hypothetical protein BDR05DRAFT_966922 [Suillus weaverae]|nr:hypothetical protein BDR05DRAFT_966910 [Suillus weaverae]KAG2340401.1 hypothetical protein BDR05DRAFT_966922 [Suillus weaverae]
MLVFRRKYHLTVRRAVPSDRASVLNLYYHVKPQPCYNKPHSDWVKHFPTLDKLSPLSLQLQY